MSAIDPTKPTTGSALTADVRANFQTAANEIDALAAGTPQYSAGAGTVDVITAALTPTITAYTNGLQVHIRALGANTSTTPTLNIDSVGAKTITKLGNLALVAGDITRAGHEMTLRYNSTNDVFELLNPNVLDRYPPLSGETGVVNYEYDYDDIRRWGADLDGTADTTAFQAAIDSKGTGGGKLTIPSDILTGAITFPTYTSWMQIDFFGTWTTTSTINVGRYMSLNGTGGYPGAQFQRVRPVAEIAPSGAVDPVIEVSDVLKKSISNVSVTGATGAGIKLTGSTILSAICVLDNVAVETANVTSAEIPLVIENFFWVWTKDCVFLSNTNSGASVHITNTDGAPAGAQSSIVYFDDVIFNGHTVDIDSSDTTSPAVMKEYHFNNCAYENGLDPFLTVDATNTPISNISINKLLIADATAGFTSFIQNDTTATPGAVRNINITNTELTTDIPIIGGQRVNGLYFDTGMQIDYTTGYKIGQNEFTAAINNKLYGKLAINGTDMSPTLLPYTTLNISQDLSTWSASGNLTVTGSQLAPDGSSTAFNFDDSAGTGTAQDNLGSLTVAVNDWVVAGHWCKSADSGATPGAASHIQFPVPSGIEFEDTGNNQIFFRTDSKDLYRSDTEWFPVSAFGKVSVHPSGATTFRYVLSCTNTTSTDYWKPWVIHIPNSLGMGEKDVVRLTQALVNLPSNVTSAGNVVSTHDHHLFRAGDGDWDGGHLIIGTHHFWMNGNDFRGSIGAPTGATDGALIQTLT